MAAPRTVLFLASGTRGDVQPIIALARGLQAAGDRAILAAPPAFAALAKHHGVEYRPLDGNPSDLMTRAGGQSALTYDGNALRSVRASLRYLREARPVYQRMLTSAWDACQGVNALVLGLATAWGTHIAEALEIPTIYAFLQPASETAEFRSSLFPLSLPGWGWVNRFSYRLVDGFLWFPWAGVINRWRKTLLRQSPVRWRPLITGARLVLSGFSEQVVPRPADWPAHHHVTGYWFLDQADGWQPPADLAQFLDSGEAPVYIGFGSPGTREPREMGRMLLEALALAEMRAVVSLPAGSLDRLPAGVFASGNVPHEWLFPRMRGLVHHGGAGTTAAGLRAGVPAWVTPLAVDQFFWGSRLAELGVGPRPVAQRSLNAAVLAQGIRQLVANPAFWQRASEVSRAIRAEDGVGRAVELIRQALG